MMKLRESLPAKIAAIIISAILFAALFLSSLCIIYMIDCDYYTDTLEEVQNSAVEARMYKEQNIIFDEYQSGGDLEEHAENRKIYFTITDSETGEVLESNYSGQEYLATHKNKRWDIYDFDNDEPVIIKTVDITVYIPDEANISRFDMFVLKMTEKLYSLRFHMLWIAAVILILSIAVLSFLYAAAGHRKGGIIERNNLDRIPFDLLSAAVLVLAFLSFIVIEEVSMFDISFGIVLTCLVLTLDYLIALAYTMTIATRLKTKTLFKNTIIYIVGKRIWDFLVNIIKGLPLIIKTILVLAVGGMVTVFIFAAALYPYSFFFAVAIVVAVSAVVIYHAVVLSCIKRGGEKIAKGDLEANVDTTYMYGDFKEFAETLNNINDGLSLAVNERMKSERFKTELITNVSHDIKTPLTSIITYIDLLKKEKTRNENIKSYVEVLDRQSARLKKLIEDLVEASKASTGNIAVNLCPCEVGVLLSQTVGEFDERLTAKNLTVIVNAPEEPVKIMADPRHLWRIFDNLMNNICKYSLEGTRVYLDVSENSKETVITFRNISAYELNISSEELMERFMRGDKSRNTEGSGLGLSIAKSLAECQKGRLDINVDGDLFKAQLTFPKFYLTK